MCANDMVYNGISEFYLNNSFAPMNDNRSCFLVSLRGGGKRFSGRCKWVGFWFFSLILVTFSNF